MTLDEFRKTCPPELRLGQHFVNAYWPTNYLRFIAEKFYQLEDDDPELERYINHYMQINDWKTLPPIPGHYAKQLEAHKNNTK